MAPLSNSCELAGVDLDGALLLAHPVGGAHLLPHVLERGLEVLQALLLLGGAGAALNGFGVFFGGVFFLEGGKHVEVRDHFALPSSLLSRLFPVRPPPPTLRNDRATGRQRRR